jgi:hypothetical protein
VPQGVEGSCGAQRLTNFKRKREQILLATASANRAERPQPSGRKLLTGLLVRQVEVRVLNTCMGFGPPTRIKIKGSAGGANTRRARFI